MTKIKVDDFTIFVSWCYDNSIGFAKFGVVETLLFCVVMFCFVLFFGVGEENVI